MLDRFYLTRHFSHRKREDLHDKVFGDYYEKNNTQITNSNTNDIID